MYIFRDLCVPLHPPLATPDTATLEASLPYYVTPKQASLSIGRKHNGLTVSSPCPRDLCWQGTYLSNSPSGHSLNFIITFTQRPHSPPPAPIQGLTTAGTLRQGHSWKIGDWQVPLAPHQPKIHPPNFPSFFLSFTWVRPGLWSQGSPSCKPCVLSQVLPLIRL